jgi:hypothetical protein
VTAPRRVRCDMVTRGAQASYPRPALYLLIEYPRIVSTCGNRRPIWEWRPSRAVEIGVAS